MEQTHTKYRLVLFTLIFSLPHFLITTSSAYNMSGDTTHLMPNFPSKKIKPYRTGDYEIRHDMPYSFPSVDKMITKAMVLENEEGDHLTEEVNSTIAEYAGNPSVRRADSAFAALHTSKLIDKLTGAELVELPVGLEKTIAGNTYTILINRVILRPENAVLEVFCRIKLSDGRILFFGSDDIKYSSEGGLIGETTLGLFADFAITKESSNMAIFLNGFQRMPGGQHEGCYVIFDCEGFVEMRVDASLHLSRNWVLPADATGNVKPGSERVKADFALTVRDWDDILVEASMPSFVLTKAKEIGFIISGVVIDMSETRNANGFVPPPRFNYLNINPDGSVSTTAGAMASLPDPDNNDGDTGDNHGHTDRDPGPGVWKGVFIQHLEIILPREFNKRNSNERVAFGCTNLYVDSRGVTGHFFGRNIIPMGNTKAGKWDMSLDLLTVDLLYNQVVRFSFEGGVALPVTDLDKPLRYQAGANLQKRHYHFMMTLNQQTSFPLFNAGTVSLDPSCMLKMELLDGKFFAMASLSGKFSCHANDDQEGGKASIELPSVKFNRLLILTEAPYLTLATNGGSITLESGGLLNNSYINVSQAQLLSLGEGRLMLGLTMEADLMNDSDGGVKTGGSFGIKARMEENEDSQRWVYDGIKLTSLTVDISIGKHVRVNGTIQIFSNHPKYEDGFAGSLAGGIIASETGEGYKFALSVNTIFGKVSGDNPYNYWFFDVFVSSEDFAVPLFAGLEANGFGGGAYHHMRMAEYKPALTGKGDYQNPSSGVIYDPDKNVAFGIKASMAIRATTGGFKGVVTLQLEFGDGLSLQRVMFYGQGEFVADDLFPGITSRLDKLTELRETTQAGDVLASEQNKADKITAAMFLEMNFNDGLSIQGSFGAFMDASKGRIKGTGTVDLLIDPKKGKWHLYIGGYSNGQVYDSENRVIPPISATISCGSFNVTASVYFLTGNDIPGAPPIDPFVAAYFGISETSNNREILKTGGRSPAAGSGFAFGASVFFNINTGEGTCKTADWSAWRWWRPWPNFSNSPVYVQIDGGVGFDISLLKYAPNTMCEASGTSPHGMKGWRAGGRLWAYMDVRGGRWRLLGCCAPIPRFSVGILLDGDVPNPSHFRAILKFSIVGINVNLKADVGESCGTVLN